jgi:hypothetical protein
LRPTGQRAQARPNDSFKPNLLRSGKKVAKRACHLFASTTQVGLTQVLGITMSHSERHDDLRRLRELKSAMNALIPVPCSIAEVEAIRQTADYRTLEIEFDRIFAKYGFNSAIFKDSERAGSKRNAARQIKRYAKRSAKRAENLRALGEINLDIGGLDDA